MNWQPLTLLKRVRSLRFVAVDLNQEDQWHGIILFDCPGPTTSAICCCCDNLRSIHIHQRYNTFSIKPPSRMQVEVL